MPRTIQVAHDFTCQWCWIGLSQARRLRAEFGVEIEWLPFEQYPEGMEFPAPATPHVHPEGRPKTPSRMNLALAAEGLQPPLARPYALRTTRAHQAVEVAKRFGVADMLVERIYGAYWRHGLDIDRLDVLLLLAKGLISDEKFLRQSLEELPDRAAITLYDDAAYAAGFFNLPTFVIEGERYAEQPYSVLRDALLEIQSEVASPYRSLDFPAAPPDRPYVVMNMVATIDGKTLSGERDEAVMDLGSKVDHATLRQLEHSVQAVMIGAGTLRATKGIWYPRHLFRFVVTASGVVDRASRFFTDVSDRAFIVTSSAVVAGPGVLRFGDGNLDFCAMLNHLRQELGIETLLVEGGSELNAQFLERELADELFLTVAPKIKLGRDTPTYAGGEPLPRERIQNYRLIEHHRAGDEIFLRYRRRANSV